MNFDFSIKDIHRVIMVGKEEYPEQVTDSNQEICVITS